MKKKLLCMIIILTLAVFLPSGAVLAADNSLVLDVSSVETAEGGTASVSFTVSSNPGMTNFDIVLSFDSEHLAYQSCSLEGGVYPGTTFQSSSELHAVFLDSAGSSLCGKVFTAVFSFTEKAEKGVAYKVSASADKTVFYNGNSPLTVQINSGSATLICKEHTYVEGAGSAATCVSDGFTEKICSVCGHKEKTIIPSSGHSVSSWTVTKEPSCAEPGEKTGVCSKCSQTVTEEIPVIDHNYGEWEISKMPTVTSLGERVRTCMICGYEESQVMAKLVTSISDPTNGASIVAEGTLSFFGTSSFTADQTLYSGLSDEEKSEIDKATASLVGKKVYSQYELQFVDEDYGKISFDGTVTVMLPLDSGLDGAVLVSIENGEFTIINAAFGASSIQFSTSAIAQKYYILCDEGSAAVVNTQSDKTTGGTEKTSAAPKGWIIAIIAAIVLLAASGAMVFIGIKHQKSLQKNSALVHDSFEVSEPAATQLQASLPGSKNKYSTKEIAEIEEIKPNSTDVFSSEKDIVTDEFSVDLTEEMPDDSETLEIDDSIFNSPYPEAPNDSRDDNNAGITYNGGECRDGDFLQDGKTADSSDDITKQ